MAATLNRAERDGIGDEPRLEARLDDKQAAQLPQHSHPLQRLSSERVSRSSEPFPT
jgi:hypothetical protein